MHKHIENFYQNQAKESFLSITESFRQKTYKHMTELKGHRESFIACFGDLSINDQELAQRVLDLFEGYIEIMCNINNMLMDINKEENEHAFTMQ